MISIQTKKEILKLMEKGAKITFPSGYYMEGEPSTKYIQLGHEFGTDGLWDMTLQGVENSLLDAKRYEADASGEGIDYSNFKGYNK